MWRSLLEDATERGVVENVKSIDTDLNRLAQIISKINIAIMPIHNINYIFVGKVYNKRFIPFNVHF